MKRLFTILAIALLTVSMFAQSPQLMSYQAVVRNSSNALVTNQAVGMRISILQGSATGTAVYVETQTPTTNANGLASLQIGGGTTVTGTFAAINWATGPYYIKTETDPTGGSNYTITGTNQMLSVPYALYAASAGNLLPPKVVNSSVFNIGQVSATVRGKINANGLSTQVILEYGTTSAYGSTTYPVQTITGTSDSLVSFNLSCTAGLTYHCRIKATNAVNSTYSNDLSFSTLNPVKTPTVTTSKATYINGNEAVAGGSITYSSTDGIITAKGLCWSTNPSPTIANSVTTSFTDTMKNLVPGTFYYVRAYATNAAGTGYGNQISFNPGQILGASYAGGIVFYNDTTGHGLVCAPTDQSTGVVWANSYIATGANGTALGTGLANTNAIVSSLGAGNYAARICYDLVLNGYSDWYLPSKVELGWIWDSLISKNLGGFNSASFKSYWSSSEADTNNAICWSKPALKNSNYYVRAIRSF
jgi:hypothetical protein